MNEIYLLHENYIETVELSFKRYNYSLLPWSESGLGIIGPRGVGKTTLFLQHLKEVYDSPEYGLYISADHPVVLAKGLLQIAKEHFQLRGKCLVIDEIHKYPNWSTELKSILDTNKKNKIYFSGSSAIEITKSSADLSRRVHIHPLEGLSFREYLNLTYKDTWPAYTLSDILDNHVELSRKLKSKTEGILAKFKDYLHHGYYPFYMESTKTFQLRLQNLIDKIIFEDIASAFNLTQSKLPMLKKLLLIAATSTTFTPNIESLSQEIGTSREYTYLFIEYLKKGGLIQTVYSTDTSPKKFKKPEKILINNPNLFHTLIVDVESQHLGSLREIFFLNHISKSHTVSAAEKGDFKVGKWVFEVGGKSKDGKQIAAVKNSFLVADNFEIGAGNKIPLYLFGFLY